MRIAFISYEAPPDTLIGGIGTYVGQAARTLASRGHEVEVFAASPHESKVSCADGYQTHLVQTALTFEDRLAFPSAVGEVFAKRHAEAPFEVLEGPEFLAEARVARKLVPEIPLVVKLHMSMTLIRRINHAPATPLAKLKAGIKKVAQPVLQLKRWQEFDYAAFELPHLMEADEISAPCREIGELTARMWNLDGKQMVKVPYPFVPPRELLEIPVATETNTIGYIGRLEQRKGVVDFAHAIPSILQRFPNTKILFAGASEASPVSGLSMREYLEDLLAQWKGQIEFLGRIPHERMAEVFRRMDVAVLPSLWENFPNACLESMAAGRGVVGSSAGGMAEQLDGGNVGLLVHPRQPKALAEAVCRYLENPDFRKDMGAKARARVLSEYSAERIGEMTEQSYQRAIAQRKAGGRKWRLS